MINLFSESTGQDIANITVPSPAGLAVDPSTNNGGPANVALDSNSNTVIVSSVSAGSISIINEANLHF